MYFNQKCFFKIILYVIIYSCNLLPINSNVEKSQSLNHELNLQSSYFENLVKNRSNLRKNRSSFHHSKSVSNHNSDNTKKVTNKYAKNENIFIDSININSHVQSLKLNDENNNNKKNNLNDNNSPSHTKFLKSSNLSSSNSNYPGKILQAQQESLANSTNENNNKFQDISSLSNRVNDKSRHDNHTLLVEKIQNSIKNNHLEFNVMIDTKILNNENAINEIARKFNCLNYGQIIKNKITKSGNSSRLKEYRFIYIPDNLSLLSNNSYSSNTNSINNSTNLSISQTKQIQNQPNSSSLQILPKYIKLLESSSRKSLDSPSNLQSSSHHHQTQNNYRFKIFKRQFHLPASIKKITKVINKKRVLRLDALSAQDSIPAIKNNLTDSTSKIKLQNLDPENSRHYKLKYPRKYQQLSLNDINIQIIPQYGHEIDSGVIPYQKVDSHKIDRFNESEDENIRNVNEVIDKSATPNPILIDNNRSVRGWQWFSNLFGTSKKKGYSDSYVNTNKIHEELYKTLPPLPNFNDPICRGGFLTVFNKSLYFSKNWQRASFNHSFSCSMFLRGISNYST